MLWIGGGTVGASAVAGLIGLFLFAGLLKIPNLASNITIYEFARLTRQFSLNADRATEQALTLEAASEVATPEEPEGFWGNIRDTYEKVSDKYKAVHDGVFEKLNNMVPKLIKDNINPLKGLKSNQGLDYATHHSPLGNTVLDSVTLDGTTYGVKQITGFAKLQSIWGNFRDGDLKGVASDLFGISNFKNQVAFSNDFVPALNDALKANDVSTIIRYTFANKLRKSLGIGLIAWTAAQLKAKFAGKSTTDARISEEQIAYDEVGAGGEESVPPSATSEIAEASQKQSDITEADVEQGGQKVLDIIKKNGVDETANNFINTILKSNIWKSIISFLSPAYAVALPACLIYDGSLDQAGPTINAQVAAQQSAYYMLADTANEQETGGPSGANDGGAETNAINATNAKFGDVTQSNAYIRANGGTVYTANSSMSTESSATGDFTLIDALPGLGGNGVGNSIKAVANTLCPALSNIWVGLGTGIAIQALTIVTDVFTAGGATGAEVAGEAGIDGVVEATSTSLVDRYVTNFIGKSGSKIADLTFGDYMAKARSILIDSAKSAGLITGLTIVAKIIVLARSNTQYDGLEQGTDLANEADAGANIHAGELERQQLFGRPLLCSEVQQSNQADKQYIAYQNQQQSFTDRYLSPKNPESLLNRTADMVYGTFGGSLQAPIANALQAFFNGPMGFGSLIRSLTGVAQAAVPCGQQDYGNVQFGWSEDEEKIIDSSTSYLPLQNQQILDQSSKEDEIASTYAKCFGYAYTSNSSDIMDPTDPNSELQSDITSGDGSLGDLLSNGDIVRDAQGNVIYDQGTCSPQNLGINNPQYGDLVFRWRLAMSYETTIGQLTNLQTVTTQ